MIDLDVEIWGCATMVVKYEPREEEVYGIVLRM